MPDRLKLLHVKTEFLQPVESLVLLRQSIRLCLPDIVTCCSPLFWWVVIVVCLKIFGLAIFRPKSVQLALYPAALLLSSWRIVIGLVFRFLVWLLSQLLRPVRVSLYFGLYPCISVRVFCKL